MSKDYVIFNIGVALLASSIIGSKAITGIIYLGVWVVMVLDIL